MNIKKAAVRSLVIIVIAALSVIVGIAYQKISVRVDKSKYPTDYSEFVEKYSSEYGVPEYVVYAVIKNESDFDSSLLSDGGKIGLMQLKPEVLGEYGGALMDSYDAGMLYDPETNIKYGTYRLSMMYLKLGTWRSVFAAMYVGEDTVSQWLTDENISDIGENVKPRLRDIPDKDAEKYTERLEYLMSKYRELYFHS